MLTCHMCVDLVVSRIMVESDYFMNLHTNLFMSSTEEIQVQDLIVGTHNFLIKSFLVCGYKCR